MATGTTLSIGKAGTLATTTAKNNAAATAIDATRKLQDISRQIKELAKRPRGGSGEVQEYRKDTRDVLFDNSATARDIGQLIESKSRLNVISALSKNDEADVFKFRVTKTAQTKMGVLGTRATDGALHYQVISRSSGRLIADSDPKSGDAHKSYQDLQSGSLEMKAGEYLLRIARMPRVDTRKATEFQYAVQFSQGSYKQDYDTVEKAYRHGTDDPFGLPATGQAPLTNLMSSIGSAQSFISSLPPIGTDATSKLTGALYDALF
jgi:hypothetical protein